MERNLTSTKMPELLVYIRALVLGFVLAEVLRIAYVGGSGVSTLLNQVTPSVRILIASFVVALLIWYAISRGVARDIERFWCSQRIDIFISFLMGASANYLSSPFTQQFHDDVVKTSPYWVLLIAAFLLLIITSPLIQAWLAPRKKKSYQMYFLTDDEIGDEADDVLANREQATQFAQTVLESGSESGLVFGIDGPWGTGKTSFINMANNYWRRNASNEVIVFRFEPLRYALDPDLAERFIRDLSAEIQQQVFVPEFRPAATRYSRMLKGKADFSFFGFKLTFTPSGETIDELLEDIDDVLRRIRRRLIVVIDDLDRLESTAVNNVLFTVRRTFKLTQAAYILCYDTENLLATKDEGERARQFLEKFINIKLSLFVDSSDLCRFLKKDWSKNENKYQTIPSDTMLKLSSILSELAEILEDDKASKYMLLIGDMRKLKRFVNAVLLMQIEKTNLARTDFNSRDLINLMLLHWYYPGIFRRIYQEETEGRSGIFSMKTNFDSGSVVYVNDDGYEKFVSGCDEQAHFLLNQLFHCDILQLSSYESLNERIKETRACFNSNPHRNLEKYLKLIVRFATPEPRATFKLYRDGVDKVIGGASVEAVLSETEYTLDYGEDAHDQFWRILVNRSHEFNKVAADDSINTLIEYLPKYSLTQIDDRGLLYDRGLRSLSIYTLIRLLDRAGWGWAKNKRLANTRENVIEIAHRIYGEQKYNGQGLIYRLAAEDRGVLGLNDLMLFRLQCSPDRQAQIYNLHTALIVHDDMEAPTDGLVKDLAIKGMRTISQRIFSLFKSRYIDKKRNLFDDVDAVSDTEFLGESASYIAKNVTSEMLRDMIEASRTTIKTFIVYQLTYKLHDTGAGITCGYYDTAGSKDGGEIAMLMNDYMFDVCFNLDINEKNAEHFLDYCLSNLTSGFSSGHEEPGYHPSVHGLSATLSADRLADYWAKNGSVIKARNLTSSDKRVVTINYIATYKDDLRSVFDVLDKIRADSQNAK